MASSSTPRPRDQGRAVHRTDGGPRPLVAPRRSGRPHDRPLYQGHRNEAKRHRTQRDTPRELHLRPRQYHHRAGCVRWEAGTRGACVCTLRSRGDVLDRRRLPSNPSACRRHRACGHTVRAAVCHRRATVERVRYPRDRRGGGPLNAAGSRHPGQRATASGTAAFVSNARRASTTRA